MCCLPSAEWSTFHNLVNNLSRTAAIRHTVCTDIVSSGVDPELYDDGVPPKRDSVVGEQAPPMKIIEAGCEGNN